MFFVLMVGLVNFSYATLSAMSQFTVEDGKAHSPRPSDNALLVHVDATLSWVPGTLATSHDVYFGTDETAVADANVASDEFKRNQDVNSFDPGILENKVTYYWRIDEHGDTTYVKGDVWQFTTALEKHWDGEAGNNLYVDGINWDSPDDPNFDNTVPGPNDTAYIDSYDYNDLSIDCNVIIQPGDDVDVGILFGPYYDPDYVDRVAGGQSSLVMTGGKLSINGDWEVAYDQDANTDVLVDLSGDSVVRIAGTFRLQAIGGYPFEGMGKYLTINIRDNVDFVAEGGQSGRNKGEMTFNISGSPHLRFGGECWRFADRGTQYLNVTGNPTIEVDGDFRCGDARLAKLIATIDGGNFTVGGWLKIGDDGSGVFNFNGGSFNFGGGMSLSCRGAQAVQIININGAELHFDGHIEMFTASGSASTTTINMMDGLLTTDANLYAPRSDASSANATINLSGGMILCKGEFQHGNDNWYMDVNDAHGPCLMRVGGDAVTAINQAITDGRFTHSVTNPDNAFRLKYMSEGPVSYIGVLPKNQAWGPVPYDGQENVSVTVTLVWNPGDDASSHDVYFGTDKQAVEQATPASLEYKGNRTNTSFAPGYLENTTNYYWRIDEVDGVNVYKGNVWSFKTEKAPIPGDLDHDWDVDWDDLAIFVQEWANRCRLGEWCGGRDINESGRVDFDDFAILAGNWLKEYHTP